MVIAGKNTHVIPYMGNGLNLKLGLNQLGIRNVSEQLFSVLLPGLNNVSLRVRYYSFYCWLITQFYKGKAEVNSKDFYPFVRRAELLVALINACDEDHGGIPGINFATESIKDKTEDSVISLKDGADLAKGKSTYWSNSGGILRQYYGASLEEIGLIGSNVEYTNVYNVTKEGDCITGRMLADEFEESVKEVRELFIQLVAKGEVTLSELQTLKERFYMKHFPLDSSERKMLQDVLLQPDSPQDIESPCHRRNTITFVLDYVGQANATLKAAGFARYMYESYGNRYRDLTAWGWYAYYLDDNWQYQLTVIFHDILIRLRNAMPQWMSIEDIKSDICEAVLSQFNASHDTSVEDVVESLTDEALADSTSEAIHNLLLKYRANVHLLEDSLVAYKKMGIYSDNFFGFIKETNNRYKSTFAEYVKYIIEDIIYRHYRVSFRKMMQTGIATQKFAFENGMLRFIDNWDPTNTSPRIDTLRNFLIDLCILSSDGKQDSLTSIGNRLLIS